MRTVTMTPIRRWCIGAAAVYTLTIAITWAATVPIRAVMNSTLPGSHWINVQSMTPAKTVKAGEDLHAIFCRSPRTLVVTDNNVRSFYRLENDQQIPAGQVKLPRGITYEPVDSSCIDIIIRGYPQRPGLYRFCQDVSFRFAGHTKRARWCSTSYLVVTDSP